MRALIRPFLPALLVLPAVGQGALGIEIREDDDVTYKYIRALNHEVTEAAAIAERALMRELEGGCQVPVAGMARVEDGKLILDAMVGSLDGTTRLDARGTASNISGANALGKRVAKKLLENGALEILEEIRTEV